MRSYYTDPDEAFISLFGGHVEVWFVLAHVGFFVGAILTARRASRHGVSQNQLAILLLFVYLGVVLGGRLFSVLFDGNLDYYRQHPSKALVFWRGGYTFYGGLLGATTAAWAVARAFGLPLLRVADMCSAGGAIGLAIGRLGCFSAGCCYGAPTSSPLGIEYRNFALPVRPIGVPLHPAPLYAAAGLAIIGVVLFYRTRRPTSQPGTHFLWFLVAYGTLRFTIEFVRADQRGTIAGLPTSQFISALVVPAAALLLAYQYHRSKAPPGSHHHRQTVTHAYPCDGVNHPRMEALAAVELTGDVGSADKVEHH